MLPTIGTISDLELVFVKVEKKSRLAWAILIKKRTNGFGVVVAHAVD
jgi:hypothetical protein